MKSEIVVIDLSSFDSCRPEIRIRFEKTGMRKKKRDKIELECNKSSEQKCHANLGANETGGLEDSKTTRPTLVKGDNER